MSAPTLNESDAHTGMSLMHKFSPTIGEVLAAKDAVIEDLLMRLARKAEQAADLQSRLERERERCAKICEFIHEEHGEHPEMALTCAAAIRDNTAGAAIANESPSADPQPRPTDTP